MAVKYWEDILETANNEKLNRELYYQDYMHRIELDEDWTRAVILEGFAKYDIANPPKEIIDDLVDIFHTEVARYGSKVPNKITPSMGKKQYAYVTHGEGKTRAKRGVVLKATRTELVTNPGTMANTVLTSARKKVADALRKMHASPKVAKGLEFAHGEGISSAANKSTIGAMQVGENALSDANSDRGYQLLQKDIKDIKVSSLIKRETVKSLRDFMRVQLALDINIDEKSRNDKATFSDTFTVTGAVKIQDKQNFKKFYDKDPNNFTKGISKTYFDALAKHFKKTLIANKQITSGQYESSPKGGKRAGNLTGKVVAANYKRALKKNPQFTIIDNTAKPFKKKAKAKAKWIAGKDAGGTVRGKKARVRGGKKARTQVTGAQEILKLKNLMNAMLPEEILKQMGSPRLNNRTGRFRNSARVTDLRVGPKGGTEIDYTYQLNPYQTFEPGGAMGSTNRDPRALIGLSIREIAKDLMGKKFIKTRRV